MFDLTILAGSVATIGAVLLAVTLGVWYAGTAGSRAPMTSKLFLLGILAFVVAFWWGVAAMLTHAF